MEDKELSEYPTKEVVRIALTIINGGTLTIDNSGQRACMGRKYCTECNRYEKTRGGGDINHTSDCVVTIAKQLITGGS